MISFVKGTLSEVLGDVIVVENGGFGINIKVPESLLQYLPCIGYEVKVYTYMYVREDNISLYGFLNRDDLATFKLLINVSGIGPKGALAMLSAISPDELRLAILTADVKKISSAPGIGKKTAERVVLELKDKIKVNSMPEEVCNVNECEKPDTDEAMEALISLGISARDAKKAIEAIGQCEGMDVEEIIKRALKNLA